MENSEITTHADLLVRIEEMKLQKYFQEEKLTNSINELIQSLHPVSLVKESLHQLVTNKQVQGDLLTIGLKAGSEFIIDKVLGRNRSIRGFLSSLFVERLSSDYISKNSSALISGIRRLINRNTDRESSQQ